MEPRKGAQGHMGREKRKLLLPFSLPIILCSSTSRAAVCYIKTTGDESDVEVPAIYPEGGGNSNAFLKE